MAQAQKAVVDDLIDRIRIGKSKESGISAMRKICDEASAVTSMLASTTSEEDYLDYDEHFWELYFGSMNLLEIRQRTDNYSGDSGDIVASSIESAMVVFGNKLKSPKIAAADYPRDELTDYSAKVKAECDAYVI